MSLLPLIAEMSGSIHVGLAALGSAIGVGFVGAKAAEATGRNPGASTKIMVISIILAALAERISGASVVDLSMIPKFSSSIFGK